MIFNNCIIKKGKSLTSAKSLDRGRALETNALAAVEERREVHRESKRERERERDRRSEKMRERERE